MAQIGEIATVVTAKTAPFSRGMRRAKGEAKSFGATVKGRVTGALQGLKRTLTSAKGMVLGFGAAVGAAGLLKKSVTLAAEAESMEVSYTTFLKSLTKAKKTLKELDKYSATTPFQSDDIKEAGKQLLAFGFESEKLMKYIRVVGNLAAGSQKPMLDFVDILGKVRASGVASMADVNRMADRGVPIYQNLAEAMGVARTEVRGLVSSAEVGFSEMWEAVKMATEEGGLFAGAVENLSKTAEGKLSTLRDNVDKILRGVGTAILGGLDIKHVTDQLTALAKTYKNDIIFATEDAVAGFAAAVKGIAATLLTLKEGWTKLKLAGKYWDKWTDFSLHPGENRAQMNRADREIAEMRRDATVRATRRASRELSEQTDRRAARIQAIWTQQERRENLPANREARRRMMYMGGEQARARAEREAAMQRQAMIKEQRKVREAYLAGDRARKMEQLVVGHF